MITNFPKPVSPAIRVRRADLAVTSVGLTIHLRDIRSVVLAAAEVSIRDAEILGFPDGSWRIAPPRILGSSGDQALSQSAIDEMNHRLAAVLVLDAMVEDHTDLEAAPAALAFAEQEARFTPLCPLEADVDFLVWRGVGRDLKAWFDVRFTRSRRYAA